MSASTGRRPRFSLWILRLSAGWGVRPALQGDVEELYEAIERSEGGRAARRWLRGQAVRSVPRLLAEKMQGSLSMWRNVLKLGWRHIRKHKLTTAINVAGLAVGTAFAVLAFLFIRSEHSFDRFHEKADRIYLAVHQVGSGGKKPSPSTPPVLGPTLEGRIPEIERIVRFDGWGTVEGTVVRDGRRALNMAGALVDPGFFEMFTFPVVMGSVRGAFEDPGSLVISRSMARTFFPDGDPVGRRLTIVLPQWKGGERDFTVSAVVDVPSASSLRFDFLVSRRLITPSKNETNWGSNNLYTFFLAAPGAPAARIEEKLIGYFEEYFRSGGSDPKSSFGSRARPVRLIPLTGLYLSTTLREFLTRQSDPLYSYVLGGMALAVLMLACVNFTNLALALSANRAKEVGMRKVVGGRRGQLVRQFLGESLMIGLGSCLLGLGLAALALPSFNRLMLRQVAMDWTSVWPPVLLIGAVVGLLAGSYPAIVLSAFRPTDVFRRGLKWFGPGRLSRALIFVQFAVSITLVVTTLGMSRQMKFMRERDLGFRPQSVVVVDAGTVMDGEDYLRIYDAFRAAARSRPGILGLTMANMYFGSEDLWGSSLKIGDEDVNFRTYVVGQDYTRTMGIEVVRGRDFAPEFPSDEGNSILINETLTKLLGFENPIGRTVAWDGPATIVGVVRDMHLRSFRFEVEPAVYFLRRGNGQNRYLMVRARSDAIPATLDFLEETWRALVPGYPFVYRFLDDDVARVFRSDGRWVAVSRSAAALLVLIAGLGSFGLTSLAAVQRTKEIGIRKVLGADRGAIVGLLSKRFALLVLAANAAAWPAAALFLRGWLREFVYRAPLGATVFLEGAGLAFAVVFGVVGIRSLRSARACPAEALRTE